MNIDELIEQLKNKTFKDMKFTVYNYIEEKGYVKELESKYGKLDIDDFEMIVLDIDDSVKKCIKSKKSSGYLDIINFRYDIENVRQKGIPDLFILIMNEYGAVVAVKLKTFDINKIM